MTYTKIKELGRGGFGVVDEVEGVDGKRWARKTFAPPTIPGISEVDLRSRFEREVRYQGEISHPNVVAIHESDLRANPPWFVMELARGTLADQLRNDGTLGGNPRKALFDILNGLEAVHTKGFKHRDLNPKNILYFDGPPERYAISDFGLMALSVGQTTTLTATNAAGGTLNYQSPECAIDFRRATTQSDIYSFGAILHDIFGRGARVPHTELSVSGALGPVVEKCTKRNVHRRFKTVASLREELFRILSTEILQFGSQREEEVVNLLTSRDELTDDDWDRVFQQIDENNVHGLSNHAIFRSLKLDHLRALAESAPGLFVALGEGFANYAQSRAFDFDYCDVVADKAGVFYSLGELDLKALVTVAMLELGTSHNRWYVERKFIEMAGVGIESALANRIRVELEVQRVDFCSSVRHVEGSISANRRDLHPVLQALLSECPEEPA